MRTRRVYEGNERAMRTGTRRLVDQSDATLLQSRERCRQIVDSQRDVVQARAPLRQVPGNRRTVISRFEQFEGGSTDGNKKYTHALRRDLINRSVLICVLPWLSSVLIPVLPWLNSVLIRVLPWLNSVLIRVLPWLYLQPERIAVKLQCFVEIRHRNPDVVQRGLHNALFMMSSTAV
jgi:hypothetical protein